MKARPYKKDGTALVPCSPADATHVALLMHGHWPNRMMPVRECGEGGPLWTWNGSTDRPSLTPSILTTADYPKGKKVCHVYITDGRVQYLGDCTHEHAGQTLDLLDVPE